MSSVHRPPMAARWTALVVSGALVGTACGSTVAGSGQAGSLAGGAGLTAPAADGLGSGSGLGPALDQTSPGALPGLPQGNTGSGSSPATGAAQAQRGNTDGSAGGGPAPQGTSGRSPLAGSAPGVTAKDLKIGIIYNVNGNEAAAAAGVKLDRGDEKKNWQAVVEEVNARGGITGRKLVPVYYEWDLSSAQPRASQEQAACATFTEDNKVFAAVSGGSANLVACLQKAGVLQATPGSYVYHDREFLRRFPTFFTQRPSQERMQADLVAALRRQNFFSGWDTALGAPTGTKAKVGVIVIDEPEFIRPLNSVLLPALRAAGHPVDPGVVYPVESVPSAAQASRGAAEMQGAVLRFRQEGVTHAIILDVNGATTLLFAQQSSNQGYYPRMGITSASGIQQLYDLKTLQAKQVNGAIGLGWMPTLDLPAGQGDKYLSGATKVCLEIIKRRTGQQFTSTTAAGVALITCDAVFPLATALQGVSGRLTLQSAVRALESVGDGLEAATVPRLFFSPTRHDGLELAFDMAWDANCPCIRYRDPGHKMP